MQKNLPIELFHWAGMNDDCLDELKRILDESPELINNTQNKNQDNALIIASRVNNPGIVKYLVENTDIDINHSSIDGNAFLTALRKDNREIAFYLFNHGIDIHTTYLGKNAINLCANHGFDEMIEALIAKNVSINHLDNSNRNVLFDVITGYNHHQNYWCFELIQEHLSDNVLQQKSLSGLTVCTYIDFLIENAANNIEKQSLSSYLLPLKSQLEFRLENVELPHDE